MRSNDWWPLLWICIFLWFHAHSIGGQSTTPTIITTCPTQVSDQSCSCYDFEDGIFLECPGATGKGVRDALSSVAGGLIQSLSIYDLEPTVFSLSADLFPLNTKLRQLQISHSNLSVIAEDGLNNIKSLETFAMVSGKLREIPQKTFTSLTALKTIDIESNDIAELGSYAFSGLQLIKINLKGNSILKISEYSFAGLETSLTELDLSDNKIKTFPTSAVRRLERLMSLRIAWNEIASIHDDRYSYMKSLVQLDLSSNNFESVPEDAFRLFPKLKMLSLYYNSVESIHKRGFSTLIELETIDISRNKIVFMDFSTFKYNIHLRTIDLSHNHIHYISGLFANLPELRELFLSENNILEISGDSFSNSPKLSVIYIQQNAIRIIESGAFSSSPELMQLYLSDNYIEVIDINVFSSCSKLTSLSLDNNHIAKIENGAFRNNYRLKELRLQNNKLTKILRTQFETLPDLLELHLQNNAIMEVEPGAFKTLKSLQHINLQNNVLTHLGDVFLHDAPSLVSIQIDSNVLASLNKSLNGQSNLKVMWLSHNKLTKLDKSLFADLYQVQRIYLNNNSIENIELGTFESMQALVFLDLSFNLLEEITSKTFAELRGLNELHLTDNRISRIDANSFAALKKLTVLNLSNNPIMKLHKYMFQKDLPIQNLYLNNCSLRTIDNGTFSNLNVLNELYLKHNYLFADALLQVDVPTLTVLDVSHNNLDGLNSTVLKYLPNVKRVYLDNCNIGQIFPTTFKFNLEVSTMSLSNNKLTTLPIELFKSQTNLNMLNLDGNDFNTMPYATLANCESLQKLSVARNMLTELDMTKLTSMKNLQSLSISENRVQILAGFPSSYFTLLTDLNLSNNVLSSLPLNFFQSLEHLDMSNNHFRKVPQLTKNLQFLNLTHNPLGQIHETTKPMMIEHTDLEELHVCGTNLSVLASNDFLSFTNLHRLYMSDNKISKISPGTFSVLEELHTLDLSNNRMEYLPQERLQGLLRLRLLNLSRNSLKEIEDLSSDLISLQVLDISYNQLEKISKGLFRNLESLAELHLYGNWLSFISPDAFRSLKKLKTLDLGKNNFKNLPINALRPLETQIKSLRTEENPINCDCDQQELWEWIRDHQKLMSDLSTKGLICNQPPELKGRKFMELEPPAFCAMPVVLKLAIQDIQPYSIFVSWKGRNHTGLHGYRVAYYPIEDPDYPAAAISSIAVIPNIMNKFLDKNTQTTLLDNLKPETRYLICVLGLGNWIPMNISHHLQNDAQSSRCTEVKTLEGDIAYYSDEHRKSSILTRRLGLIIGSCLGCVVFIVLVSVLGYLKIKKQREDTKREQPLPPEYLSYRHFSLHTTDPIVTAPALGQIGPITTVH